MPKPKNIQIPYNTFKQLIYVLEHLNLEKYDKTFKIETEGILDALKAKENDIEKRKIYSKLISANKNGDEDEQLGARIEYLQKKR